MWNYAGVNCLGGRRGKVWWVNKVTNIILNDATGRIHVRLPRPTRLSLFGELVGRYLMIAGMAVIEWRSGGWDFNAYGSRFVSSADEISYHIVECCHAKLSLQRLRDAKDIEETTTVVVAAEAAEKQYRSRARSSHCP